MASFFAQGRLGTEIYNQPLYGLWMLVEHTPAGDSLMRGETYAVIKKRIVQLSGMDKEEVDRIAKNMRDIKLAQEMADGGVDPSKREIRTGWAGGAFTCGFLEEEAY